MLDKYSKMYNKNFLGTSGVSIFKFYYASFKWQYLKGKVTDLNAFLDNCVKNSKEINILLKIGSVIPFFNLLWGTGREQKFIAEIINSKRKEVEQLFMQDDISDEEINSLLYGIVPITGTTNLAVPTQTNNFADDTQANILTISSQTNYSINILQINNLTNILQVDNLTDDAQVNISMVSTQTNNLIGEPVQANNSADDIQANILMIPAQTNNLIEPINTNNLTNEEQIKIVKDKILKCYSIKRRKQLGDRIFGYIVMTPISPAYTPKDRLTTWQTFFGEGLVPSDKRLHANPKLNRSKIDNKTLLKHLYTIREFFLEIDLKDVVGIIQKDIDTLLKKD